MNDQVKPGALETPIDLQTEFPRLKHISSKHLKGICDLVVAAPLKPGFVDAFEHVTYETRARITLDALQKMRLASSYFNLISPLLDSAELIQSIRSFRLAIVEIETETGVEKRLVLAVTFDQPWEPYIRQIWNPLGRMLDVVFCHCQGYVTAVDHSYEEYANWVRENQVDSGFFYVTSTLTVTDFGYLLHAERLQREVEPLCPRHGDKEEPSVDILATGLRAPDPFEVAAQVRRKNRPKTDDIALEALGGLFRLTSYFPADRPLREARYLHRAAHSLLRGWNSGAVAPEVRAQFEEWLEWYEDMRFSDMPADDIGAEDGPISHNVQAGILSGYEQKAGAPISHGALLLMKVVGAEGARNFLQWLRPQIATEASARPKDDIFVNLAMTFGGLKHLDVPADALRQFPQEFIEGSEERALLIGDGAFNHPRRWPLPERNWPADGGGRTRPRVALSEIDLVVQLRVARDGEARHDLFGRNGRLDDGHPLADKVRTIAREAKERGVELLSVQPMRSRPEPVDGQKLPLTREHFGFLDGFSQPVLGNTGPERDRIRHGDLLRGYRNSRNDPPQAANDYLHDGSFLVVRKLRQHVKVLEDWLAQQRKLNPGVDSEDLLARMVGRRRDGTPLVESRDANDFHYGDDPPGFACPLESHVRRANPRLEPRPGEERKDDTRPRPRIMRRGMSYGPPYSGETADAERGLVFMCYQSSIAEQYEAVQRWLNGGNSTSVGSPLGDPLTGAGRPDDARTFRWSDGKTVHRHRLELRDDERSAFAALVDWLWQAFGRKELAKAHADARGGNNPFVGLEWLLYLFTPSIAAINSIAQQPGSLKQVELDVGHDVLLDLGKKLIAKARTSEKLLDTMEQLEPLRRAKYGFESGKGYVPESPRWRKPGLPRSLRYLWALIVIGWTTARKRLAPRAGDLDHLGRVGVAWKSFLEDFGAKDPGERAYGTAVWAAIREDGGVMRVPYSDNASEHAAKKWPAEDPDDLSGELKAKARIGRRPTQKVVLVASHDLVMEVFEDPPERYSYAERFWAFWSSLVTRRRRGRYSVEGELPRMRESLGEIFVGMDPGPKYYREAAGPHRVLGEFAGKPDDEEEAFAVAYEASKRILDKLLADGDVIRKALLPAGEAAKRERTAKIDLTNQFVTPALADVCTYWFGIPDPEQHFIQRGTWRRTAFKVSELPRCPGDFMAPSRYMFYPDPNPAVQKYAQDLGKRLRDKAVDMFKELRGRGLTPHRGWSESGERIPAPIAAAMFGEIPDTELLARSIIGAMIGMLPPTDGNLRGALHGWLKDKTLWRIQHALATAQVDANEQDERARRYQRAKSALERPLIEAMQKRPAPDLVFRTALRNLELGGFEVRKGETLIVGIVSATTEKLSLKEKYPDVYPVFGGKRTKEPHAVHACPGYYLAMGTMLGILAALLDRGAIDPLAGSLMIRLTDLGVARPGA